LNLPRRGAFSAFAYIPLREHLVLISLIKAQDFVSEILGKERAHRRNRRDKSIEFTFDSDAWTVPLRKRKRAVQIWNSSVKHRGIKDNDDRACASFGDFIIAPTKMRAMMKINLLPLMIAPILTISGLVQFKQR
jgi:hypothetical protein